eukprot:5480324-Amphidinium_carterae.1
MSKGSVVLYYACLLHGSGENQVDVPRTGLPMRLANRCPQNPFNGETPLFQHLMVTNWYEKLHNWEDCVRI